MTKYMLKCILTILALSGLFGIPEYFMKENVFYPDYGHPWQAYRVASIYGHPIMYALSMTVGFIIAFFVVKKHKLLKVMLLLVFSFGVFTSLSRSSWIAFFAIILILFIAAYKDKITKKRIFRLIVGMVVLIAFLLTPMGQGTISTIGARFENLLEDISSTQRLGSITYILDNIWDTFNPITLLFGHGEDAAARLMLKTTINIDNFSTTDNEFLLVLYNYGLVALIGLFVFFLRITYVFIAKYKELEEEQRCLMLSCISMFITSFFFEITEAKTCGWVSLVFIGILLGNTNDNKVAVYVGRRRSARSKI